MKRFQVMMLSLACACLPAVGLSAQKNLGWDWRRAEVDSDYRCIKTRDHLHHGIRSHTITIIAVLAAGVETEVTLLKQGLRGMQDPCRLATIDEMLGQSGGQADARVELFREDESAVGALRLVVEAGETRLLPSVLEV